MIDEEWRNIFSYPDYLISSFGRVWTACARFIGSSPAHVSNCVSGKRKRHKGLTFEFVDKEDFV